MILGSVALCDILPRLLDPYDYELVNPASIDIRIGAEGLIDAGRSFTNVFMGTKKLPFMLPPGWLVLVGTYERITVPSGLVVELRLKSSSAREGFDHSLAFWFDPGWKGIGTMEIKNIRREVSLPLWEGKRFAQIIVHRIEGPSKLYNGRYQYAAGPELPKAEP